MQATDRAIPRVCHSRAGATHRRAYDSAVPEAMERHAIAVRGIVQGVGFRPFVHSLASRHQLRGFVTNDREGVAIEVEGDAHAVERFERELLASPPPLARIDHWSARPIPPRGDPAFRIESSRSSALAAVVTPDAATCRACLDELVDPSHRRYGYAHITCAQCGLRLTIITGARGRCTARVLR
jgi:hydrogenase maturation protein HypF